MKKFLVELMVRFGLRRFFFECEFRLREGGGVARPDDLDHVLEAQELLLKEIRAILVGFRDEDEPRDRTAFTPFEEKAPDGRALPPEKRLHPRQKAGSIFRFDFIGLLHRAPPDLSQLFFRGSDTTIVSMDWPAGHMG
ncbi:MAG: hypothetical protein IPL89_14550 [Acidobacteria bacterium]|nr:hypothetical protein [Acidobacteriota bacterium]